MDKFQKRIAQNEKAEIVQAARQLISMNRAGTCSIESVIQLGDRLTRDLVAGCEGLIALLTKWNAHHYRPTLRGDIDPRAIALADLYDHVALELGVDVKAYRG